MKWSEQGLRPFFVPLYGIMQRMREIFPKAFENFRETGGARLDESEEYTVALPVYEGPMDLLLHLVTKHRIDIHDIPIHEITDQYLAYLERARRFDLPLASSFFSMAATLLWIKSRMLLPRHTDEAEEEDEDPRVELARSLEDFKKMKELREEVETLLAEEAPYRRREGGAVRTSGFSGTIPVARMMAALSSLFEERAAEVPRVMETEEVSFSDKTEALRDFLAARTWRSLRDYFLCQHSRLSLAVSLVALLELIRTGEVEMRDAAEGLTIRLGNA